MSLWDGLRSFFSLEPLQTRSDPFLDMPTLEQQITTIQNRGPVRPWRTPSIREALGVPAIQRAVSLIANTTGSLSVQGFRNGALMDEPPRVITRPDPFHTPRDFYRDTAFAMATRGEAVWWIASRDGDGLASALINVPLAELTVEENQRNRLFPVYTWGKTVSTRYSPANPEGAFVHITYLQDAPFALRGVGPLQLCGAATSVSVEAQEWAANFYADGGYPSIGVKIAGETDAPETLAFKAQWINTPNNVTRFYNSDVDEIKEFGANAQGAQMLEARQHNNGDAARMFGIPGSLLEYQQPGSSLTYQNLEGEFAKFVRACLAPNYLEPIEQAQSDLLPRSTASRFNVKGFYRADAKTRAEIYSLLVPLGVLSVEQAQAEEGLVPGDAEYAPIPFAPPAAIPSVIPQVRSVPEEIRCDGMTLKRRSGISRVETCGKLLSTTGTFIGQCPRCRKDHDVTQARSVATVQPVAFPPARSSAVVTVQPVPDLTIRELVTALPGMFAAALPRPEPTPAPVVNFHEGAFRAGDVNVAAAPAPNVTIADGAVALPRPEPSVVNFHAGAFQTDVHNPPQPSKRVERDPDGRVLRLVNEE
jgi:HK97 family phage portal protein